jgi:hypothetical protein
VNIHVPLRKSACGLTLLAVLTACQTAPKPSAGKSSPYADLPPAELRDVLAELANAHGQKLQLATFLNLPFMGVDEPFKDFFSKMESQQRELNVQLRAWADARHLDLTFHYGTDSMGQAVKIMESRQGSALQTINRVDRERQALIQMYTDYEYRVSLLQALLPSVRDPALKAYVGKSLKIHEDGSALLVELLRRFKPA